MKLDTFESDAIPDVFVTLPSAEARTTIIAVEKLAALRLRVVRPGYTVRSGTGHAAFVDLICTQIADSGYALHGFDLAFTRDSSADPDRSSPMPLQFPPPQPGAPAAPLPHRP
jgi:hypothetical protein